jgi:hypothetical protein
VATVADPLSRPENERRDPEREEENEGVAPGTVQPGPEKVTEFSAVIGIERRLEELPGRAQAEAKDRDGKLREPS